MEDQGFRLLRGGNGRRPGVFVDERQLSEEIAGIEHAEKRFLARFRGQDDLDLTLKNQEKARPLVAFMEDDFATPKRPMLRGGLKRCQLVRRQCSEERHAAEAGCGYQLAPPDVVFAQRSFGQSPRNAAITASVIARVPTEGPPAAISAVRNPSAMTLSTARSTR